MAEGKSRPVTEFDDVPVGLSFKELNMYINELDNKKNEIKNNLFTC